MNTVYTHLIKFEYTYKILIKIQKNPIDKIHMNRRPNNWLCSVKAKLNNANKVLTDRDLCILFYILNIHSLCSFFHWFYIHVVAYAM